MPIINTPPYKYMVLKDVLKQLGMSRQNFYQSGLADFVHLEYTVYEVGKTRLYQSEDIQEMEDYLEYRNRQVQTGQIAENHPLVDAAMWERATGNQSETLDRETGL